MLDCRGLACPQPVIRTKELLETEAPQRVDVLVDNAAAGQNVSRFLSSKGFEAGVERKGADYLVSGVLDPAKIPQEEEPMDAYTCSVGEDIRQLVFIRSDTLGRGDDALGRGLMKNFVLTLKEMGPALWRILLVNSGVKLAVEGSESLDTLLELEKSGVSLLVCGTCLNHFGLLEKKKAGETTNMLDIVTSLQLAGKVITV